MLVCYLYIFFVEFQFSFFGAFFNWVVCFLIVEF